MQVDVDNTFNSLEDRVQYAVGSMDAFSINLEHINLSGGACYPGIIAMSHTAALIKFLKHCPSEVKDHSIKVTLCE